MPPRSTKSRPVPTPPTAPVLRYVDNPLFPALRSAPTAVSRASRQKQIPSSDELIGVISWSDILRLSFADALGSDDRAVDATLDHSFTLEQVMSADPITISSHHGTVREAAEILAKGKFHALPVVDGKNLVGLVTSSDLLRYLADLF